MSELSAWIIDSDMSEYEFAQSCAVEGDSDGFDQYERELNEYLEYLVDLYMDRLVLYNWGIVGSFDFMPETLHDVYHSNLYCMSWFYEDGYPFEGLEDELDSELADGMIQDILEYELAEYL